LTLESPKRFRVALSFPGEQRPFVAQVAERLAADLGRQAVLYDAWYEPEFARPDLDTYLQSLYHDHSELIAVFFCADYERKEWCGLEWRAVRDLIKRRRAGRPIPGVTVALPEQGLQTQTDALGRFSLEVPGRGEQQVQLIATGPGLAPHRQYILTGSRRLSFIMRPE
jgi:hypothetical protein